MSGHTENELRDVFSQLNTVLLQSEEWRNDLTEDCISTGWCGSPPATAGEISGAEARLGIRFPHSYRVFLTISNGWRPFNSSIERLLPVQEVQYFKIADPEKLVTLQRSYDETNITDKEYRDYEDSKHMEALRHRYYPESLLVSKPWGVEDDMVLLNPQIISDEGEWEVIFFANWIPGNQRYRSFFEFVAEKAKVEHGLRTGRP
jgi:SMI1 / KNR4 family (SUKH-1)